MAENPDGIPNSISCSTNTCFLGQTIEININDPNPESSLKFYDNNTSIEVEKPSSSFIYNYTPSYAGTHTIYIRAILAGMSSNTITITVIEPTLNASLEKLGEKMATNLNTMGVDNAQASDGLTTLANKILNIPR